LCGGLSEKGSKEGGQGLLSFSQPEGFASAKSIKKRKRKLIRTLPEFWRNPGKFS
jgi:hypothetical protein